LASIIAMSRFATLFQLLHGAAQASLATHSASLPGYPFASAVAFAPDDHHCPVILISRLAEHSRNLAEDPRASLMVSHALGQGELARATLLGDMVALDSSKEWTARYLRYQPDGERFLQLGDFGFYRIEIRRIQVIGGFAKASWLEPERLLNGPAISLDQEACLLPELKQSLPPGLELLGLDAYGADLRREGKRQRLDFGPSPIQPDDLAAAFAEAMSREEGARP
jgi:hypothetical protein